MSKRYIFPQQYGERKKPKLDFSVTGHNFPLSQNAGPSKVPNQVDTWGDDNDDEILLLASQACEDAYSSSNDTSNLPDYSLCMQPASTSTQISMKPQPSTSKTSFSFKKPTSATSNVVSTSLNSKCHRISSPLPGITPKVMQNINGHVNLTDDLIFNDKIYKAQDSEHIYRQMLQLQEENAKLKSENGKLLEKCVTKEGEASILRTQLKTCQVAVDNARLEKLKAHERVQMEWTDKLTAANKQMQDLRTQLDFKNLEIISTKEKCKMLESNKVKLTQVTVAGNDISFSHRNNSIQQDTQSRRVKSSTSAVQTDNQTYFLKLNKAFRSVPSKLKEILPLILNTSTEQQNSILDYSETLQKPTEFSQNKCRIFSTFHRIPNSTISKGKSETKLSISRVYEDLTHIATALDKGMEDEVQERYFNLFRNINKSLEEVQTQLETISHRMTSSFQKEMDERYVDASNTYLGMCREDLLSGKSLYKEEQGILARRMAAIAARIVEATDKELVKKLLEFEEAGTSRSDESFRANILDVICRICYLLDSTSCTVIYSGLLLSIAFLLENLWDKTDNKQTIHKKLLDIVRIIITSRPMAAVSTQMLSVLKKLASFRPILVELCAGNIAGNLKLDYDQGVLLYRKESCCLQVFLKQIEAALKCIERQCLVEDALYATQQLIAFYCNVSTEMSGQDKSRCDCNLVMSQVMVYALQICAVMLNNLDPSKGHLKSPLESVCRCGLLITYQWVVRDVECPSQLGHHEGHFHVFLETCDVIKDTLAGCDVLGNILPELLGTLQPTTEDIDMPSNLHRQVWMDSFSRFSIAD